MSLFKKKTANIEEQMMQDVTDEQLTQVNGGLLSQVTDTLTDTTSGLLGSVGGLIPQAGIGAGISKDGILLGATVTH